MKFFKKIENYLNISELERSIFRLFTRVDIRILMIDYMALPDNVKHVLAFRSLTSVYFRYRGPNLKSLKVKKRITPLSFAAILRYTDRINFNVLRNSNTRNASCYIYITPIISSWIWSCLWYTYVTFWQKSALGKTIALRERRYALHFGILRHA